MVDINDLKPDQLAELERQFEAKKRAEAERMKREKMSYTHLKDVTVEKVFARLQKASVELENLKAELYNEFDALLNLKSHLYGIKDTQQSHNWTNTDGTVTIITGFNTIDAWDDTKSVGIAKVNEWLDNQVTDDNKKFVSLIRELLKPTEKGDLKANRILDLQNQADIIGDKELIDAVKILRESHRTVRSATYIRAEYKDANGERRRLPLSMSSV